MSGSMPFERESRAHARAAADSLRVLPAGEREAALPASMRNWVWRAALARTAMLAVRHNPINVDGAMSQEKTTLSQKVCNGDMSGSLVEIGSRQRCVDRIFWPGSLDWRAQRYYLPSRSTTAGTPISKRIGARRAGRDVTAQRCPMKISEPAGGDGECLFAPGSSCRLLLLCGNVLGRGLPFRSVISPRLCAV